VENSVENLGDFAAAFYAKSPVQNNLGRFILDILEVFKGALATSFLRKAPAERSALFKQKII